MEVMEWEQDFWLENLVWQEGKGEKELRVVVARDSSHFPFLLLLLL